MYAERFAVILELINQTGAKAPITITKTMEERIMKATEIVVPSYGEVDTITKYSLI